MDNQKKHTRKVIYEHEAFVKGYNEVRARKRGRGIAILLMDEIASAISDNPKRPLSKTSMVHHKRGWHTHSIGNREKIEQIFARYGVTDPWGLA